MKTVSCPVAPVKSEAQKYANSAEIPARKGGYRTWPFEQRRVTLEALRDRFVEEDGLSAKQAWKKAYWLVKQRWIASLSVAEKIAYLHDAATADALPDVDAKKAFWAQEAEGGAR